MPELPEVETARRQIARYFLHKRVKDVRVHTAAILKNCSPEALKRSLRGKVLSEISRQGKHLILQFEGTYLVIHLGMSGIFLRDRSASRYPQHIHLEIQFDTGEVLYYQDMRKFGKIFLYHHPPVFEKLGIDPFDKKFTLNNFKKLLKLKHMNVKLFLMDQSLIAGIGNIYASEILFDAGISPLRKTDSLKDSEIERLYRSIKKNLKKAIERFGTTYSAYRTVEGMTGENQHFLQVYHREGQPCLRCGTPIQKIILGSRSTFFCPKCQPV